MSAKSKVELCAVLVAMIFDFMFLLCFDNIESEVVFMLNALSFLCGGKLTYEAYELTMK